MSCDTYRDLIPLYILNELSETDAQQVKTHLAECGICAKEYEDYTSMLATMDKLEPSALTDSEKARMKQAITSRLSTPSPMNINRSSMTIRLILVAAAVIIFVGGYLIGYFAKQPDVINSAKRTDTTISQIEQIPASQLSSQRLTIRGLKLIAKGMPKTGS